MLLGLGALAAVLFPVVSRGLDASRRQTREAVFLKQHFAEVRAQGDKVLLAPAFRRRLRTADAQGSGRPRAFGIGEQFKVDLPTGLTAFRVERIESHGAVLRRATSDGAPSTGPDMILTWK